MKRIQFYVNDSFYECAKQESKKQGRDDASTDGVGSLAKGALRAYLNKNGYKAQHLDEIGAEAYPELRKNANRQGEEEE